MVTQREIILEFYENNPDRDIGHPEVVDWATQEYTDRTGKVFRDPDRMIRTLFSENRLIKVRNGVYRYNPGWDTEVPEELFTPEQREEIFEGRRL